MRSGKVVVEIRGLGHRHERTFGCRALNGAAKGLGPARTKEVPACAEVLFVKEPNQNIQERQSGSRTTGST